MGATSGLYSDGSMGNGPLFVFDVNNGRDIAAHYKDGAEAFAFTPDGEIRTTSGWRNRILALGLGDVAANNDAYTYPLMRFPFDVEIVSANIGADSDVTANASNYQTVYLEQSGNETDLGSLTTASVGFSKHVPRAIAAATTNSTNILKAGETLQLRIAKTGSGVAMYGVNVSVVFRVKQLNTTLGDAADNVLRYVNDIGTDTIIGGNVVQRPCLSIRRNGNEVLGIDADGKMHGEAPDQYYISTVNTGQLVTGESGAKKAVLLLPAGTFQVEAVYFGAISTHAIDSNTHYWKVAVTDGSNTLVDGYIFGPYGAATSLVKGLLYDMGDINPQFGRNSTKIQAEFTQSGTGPNVDGLTLTVVWRKVA